MLYDLDSDPGEMKNLASSLPRFLPQYRSLLAGTRALMESFYGDKENLARGKLLEKERRAGH